MVIQIWNQQNFTIKHTLILIYNSIFFSHLNFRVRNWALKLGVDLWEFGRQHTKISDIKNVSIIGKTFFISHLLLYLQLLQNIVYTTLSSPLNSSIFHISVCIHKFSYLCVIDLGVKNMLFCHKEMSCHLPPYSHPFAHEAEMRQEKNI